MRSKKDMSQAPHPATPKRSPGFVQILGARIAGRRDNTKGIKTSQAGHHPYTTRLEAETRRQYGDVARWLLMTVKPLDVELARLSSARVNLMRERQRADTKLTAAEAEEAGSSGTAVVTTARASRLAGDARLRLVNECAQLEIRVSEVATSRRLVLDEARAAVISWEAIYDQLVAHYQRAYQRRDASQGFVEAPKCRANFEWIEGDLPLLVAVFDQEARHFLETVLTSFHPAVSSRGGEGDTEDLDQSISGEGALN